MKLYRESLQGLLKRQGGKLPLAEVFTDYSIPQGHLAHKRNPPYRTLQ